MTDAEYAELKYAAIAMGEKPVRLSDDGRALLMWGIDDPWNPRTSNRDAFLLMVKLEITFQYSRNAPPELGLPRECAMAVTNRRWYAERPAQGDEAAASRLAITRAAAEIGKQMGGADV